MPSATKFATLQEHKFRAANINSYHQRKTFWEIFATFNFFIVLLAAQINRKIESDIDFSGTCDQVNTLRVTAKMTARHRVSVFVSLFFSFKVYKVRQEMFEFNTKITIDSAKSKIDLIDQGPVSRKSRNFTGHFRVSQFPLYLKNGEDLSRQTSQLFFFLLP